MSVLHFLGSYGWIPYLACGAYFGFRVAASSLRGPYPFTNDSTDYGAAGFLFFATMVIWPITCGLTGLGRLIGKVSGAK